MAYLAINGYELPPPKRGVRPTVTTVVDAGRNANGSVVGQRVGRDQYKIDGLEWSWLTADQWAQILSVLSHFFVYVTFTDPVSNSSRPSKCTAAIEPQNPIGSMKTGNRHTTEIAR